jgi:acylphosphatase
LDGSVDLDPPVVRVRLTISGRVQGVFYRDTCHAEARRLGVRGWVRNRPDGTVEVVAEGTRSAVGRLVAWCRLGPSRAHVTDVAIIDEEPIGESTFRVRG